MSNSRLYIRSRGTYEFDADVYDQWMTYSKRDLCEEIFSRGYADEHGATRAEYRALAAYQLAAILAESDTAARDNERDVERRAQDAEDRGLDVGDE